MNISCALRRRVRFSYWALEAWCPLEKRTLEFTGNYNRRYKDRIGPILPHFIRIYTSGQDYFDYDLPSSGSGQLKGKHYQPKRNHVNSGKEYRYKVWAVNPGPYSGMLTVRIGMVYENTAISKTKTSGTNGGLWLMPLHHFEELDLTGAVISVDDKIAAFTFGAPISYNTFGVHYEKQISISTVFTVRSQPRICITSTGTIHLPEPWRRSGYSVFARQNFLSSCIITRKDEGRQKTGHLKTLNPERWIKQQVMELWRRCFEDTDEFIRFYFERKYSNANSLIYEENGEALSALQMLPLSHALGKCHGRYVLYLGEYVPLPDVRNRGFLWPCSSRMLCRRCTTVGLHSAPWFQLKIGYSVIMQAKDMLPSSIMPFTTYTPANQTMPNTFSLITSDRTTQTLPGIYPYFDQEMSKGIIVSNILITIILPLSKKHLSEGQLWATLPPKCTDRLGLGCTWKRTGFVSKELLFDTEQEKQGSYKTFMPFGLTKLSLQNSPLQFQVTSVWVWPVWHMPHKCCNILPGFIRKSLSHSSWTTRKYRPITAYIPLPAELYAQTKFPDRSTVKRIFRSLTKALLGYHPDLLPAPLNRLFREARPYMNLMLD